MNHYKLFFATFFSFALLACTQEETVYDASGVFETSEVIISAKGTGEILQLDIKEGQEVSSNEKLGQIDNMHLSLQKKQLSASLSANDSKKLNENTQLASIKQQIENLKAEEKRFEDLVKLDAAPQKQLDDIRYQIDVLNKQLNATSDQVGSTNQSISKQSASISAQVAQIDNQIKNCEIICPINGTILSKYAEQGEYAVPGKALFKVGNLSEMYLRAYISAPQLTAIKIGQKTKVFADLGASGRKEFTGIISWISDEAEFTPKTIQTRDERSNLVYAVKILVKNDGTIKRGMYGDIKF